MVEGELNNNIVTSKHPKMDNNTHFVVHVSPSIFGFLHLYAHNTQYSFKNVVGYLYFSYVDYCMSNVHRSFCVFVCFQPPKYLSPDRAITFQIFLGIHPSKMGLKFVYYYLYYVEE